MSSAKHYHAVSEKRGRVNFEENRPECKKMKVEFGQNVHAQMGDEFSFLPDLLPDIDEVFIEEVSLQHIFQDSAEEDVSNTDYSPTTTDNSDDQLSGTTVSSSSSGEESVNIDEPSKILPAAIAMRKPQSRTERTIGAHFLPEECRGGFRITLSANSPLLDDYLWQRMQDDLRVIGFLSDCGTNRYQCELANVGGWKAVDEEVFQHLYPLSLSSFCLDSGLYKPVIKHLPLLYAVRLCILRMLGRMVYIKSAKFSPENAYFQCLLKPTIRRVVLFFQSSIANRSPKVREPIGECSNSFSGSPKKSTKRARVDFTELGVKTFRIKTWQPTVSIEFLLPILLSCKNITQDAERKECFLPFFYVSGQGVGGEYFKSSSMPSDVDRSTNLASYPWNTSSTNAQHSVNQARRTVLHMLCTDVYLSGIFCIQQLWGRSEECEAVCSSILTFTLAESSRLNSSAVGDCGDVSGGDIDVAVKVKEPIPLFKQGISHDACSVDKVKTHNEPCPSKERSAVAIFVTEETNQTDRPSLKSENDYSSKFLTQQFAESLSTVRTSLCAIVFMAMSMVFAFPRLQNDCAVVACVGIFGVAFLTYVQSFQDHARAKLMYERSGAIAVIGAYAIHFAIFENTTQPLPLELQFPTIGDICVRATFAGLGAFYNSILCIRPLFRYGFIGAVTLRWWAKSHNTLSIGRVKITVLIALGMVCGEVLGSLWVYIQRCKFLEDIPQHSLKSQKILTGDDEEQFDARQFRRFLSLGRIILILTVGVIMISSYFFPSSSFALFGMPDANVVAKMNLYIGFTVGIGMGLWAEKHCDWHYAKIIYGRFIVLLILSSFACTLLFGGTQDSVGNTYVYKRCTLFGMASLYLRLVEIHQAYRLMSILSVCIFCLFFPAEMGSTRMALCICAAMVAGELIGEFGMHVMRLNFLRELRKLR